MEGQEKSVTSASARKPGLVGSAGVAFLHQSSRCRCEQNFIGGLQLILLFVEQLEEVFFLCAFPDWLYLDLVQGIFENNTLRHIVLPFFPVLHVLNQQQKVVDIAFHVVLHLQPILQLLICRLRFLEQPHRQHRQKYDVYREKGAQEKDKGIQQFQKKVEHKEHQ